MPFFCWIYLENPFNSWNAFCLSLPTPRERLPDDNLPVHSFQTLLDDLATIVKNTIKSNIGNKSFIFDKVTQPTPIQQRAIDLLEITMICTQ